jgi:hypothetical protein
MAESLLTIRTANNDLKANRRQRVGRRNEVEEAEKHEASRANEGRFKVEKTT